MYYALPGSGAVEHNADECDHQPSASHRQGVSRPGARSGTVDAARRMASAGRGGRRARRGRKDRDLRSAHRQGENHRRSPAAAGRARRRRVGRCLERAIAGNSPTGVVASARIPSVKSSAVLKPAPALVLAAAGLQDPGNAGAIIRSSAAAGATGVVLDELSADPWGWKALRASMGTAFRLPVVRSRARRDFDRRLEGGRRSHCCDRSERRRVDV